MNQKLRNLLVFLGMMVFTMILELALNSWNVKDENIYLVFVLSILIVIVETKSIYYGILGSALLVLSFDYFITEPTYTFVVNDANNYVSFIMFLVVTFMVNYLVTQAQKQTLLAKENEQKIHSLYRFSTDFLHCQSRSDVYRKVYEDLNEGMNSRISVLSEDFTVYGEAKVSDALKEHIRASMKSNAVLSSRIPGCADMKEIIFQSSSSLRSYGVILAEDGERLSEKDREFIENVVEELVVVLDKNYVMQEQQKTKIQVENEKFKTSLLRGLSHDIKTPLTMIQGGSNLLMESFDSIEDETKKELIRDIYDESCDLGNFVENLLDMTRLDERVKLNRKNEPVDDILAEVNEKMKRILGSKKLILHPQKELCFVYADTSLLSQVLMNLIDNAIKHTKEDTTIEVFYEENAEGIQFTVTDNGGGIAEEKIKDIFSDFYSIANNQDRKRNHGLGLGICKSIVEAHGGSISARNNENGGVSFTFTIPQKERREKE